MFWFFNEIQNIFKNISINYWLTDNDYYFIVYIWYWLSIDKYNLELYNIFARGAM